LHDRAFVVTAVVVTPHRSPTRRDDDDDDNANTEIRARNIFARWRAGATRENALFWRLLLGDDERRDSESSDENDAATIPGLLRYFAW